MWFKVSEIFFFKHHIVPLGAKWRNVSRICDPQFATLSHIESQKMWRNWSPLRSTWPHFATLAYLSLNSNLAPSGSKGAQFGATWRQVGLSGAKLSHLALVSELMTNRVHSNLTYINHSVTKDFVVLSKS